MNKFLQYVMNGKGIGSVWLLLLALISTVYLSLGARSFMFASVPYVQQVADELLPVSVKDGKIVSPENIIRELTFTGDNPQDTYSFVLDTTQDTLDTTKLTNGVYFSRLYAYVVNDDQIKTTKLSASFDLPKQDYKPFLNSAVKWIVLGVAIAAIVVFFIIYFILAVFYAYCTWLAAKINKVNLAFDTKMRLNSLLLVMMYVLTYILSAVGLNVHILLFFLIMIIAQIMIVKKLPQQ